MSVSETDSFIDEVSEEVRRDQLYGTFKRYGWIALTLVLAIVGAAAFNEWRKAQTIASNQANGDQLLAALEMETPGARADALSALSFDDVGKQALVKLHEGAMLVEDLRIDEAVAVFEAVEGLSEAPAVYRDLAKLKLVQLRPDAEQTDTRIADLSVLGRPFRLLAIEQRALGAIQSGNTDAAIEDLSAIITDQTATQELRERAGQLIVVLGGEIPQVPTLLPGTDNG